MCGVCFLLAQFRHSILEQVHEDRKADINPIPPKANLDLDQVLESDFFFA